MGTLDWTQWRNDRKKAEQEKSENVSAESNADVETEETEKKVTEIKKLDAEYFNLGDMFVYTLTQEMVEEVSSKLSIAVNEFDAFEISIDNGFNAPFNTVIEKKKILSELSSGSSNTLNSTVKSIIDSYYILESNYTTNDSEHEEKTVEMIQAEEKAIENQAFITEHTEIPVKEQELIGETECERIKNHFSNVSFKFDSQKEVNEVANIMFNLAMVTNTRNLDEFDARNKFYNEFVNELNEIKDTKVFEIMKMIAMKNPFYKNLYIVNEE